MEFVKQCVYLLYHLVILIGCGGAIQRVQWAQDNVIFCLGVACNIWVDRGYFCQKWWRRQRKGAGWLRKEGYFGGWLGGGLTVVEVGSIIVDGLHIQVVAAIDRLVRVAEFSRISVHIKVFKGHPVT